MSELRVSLTRMSEQEIAQFTSGQDTDILSTPAVDSDMSKMSSSKETDQTENTGQEFALDLTSHETRDSSEAEHSMEINQALDLS